MADDYLKDIEKYKNILKKSKTAYGAGITPTSRDVSAQTNLMKAQSNYDYDLGNELKEQYYDDETPEKEKEGYLSKVLHGLGMPLYGVVGGVEALLGKGTKKGLANIPENVKEEGTFGDLLRSYDIPNVVSMPLGLSLDIAFDPVNWGTAGTAALLPRIGTGMFIKGGGVKGAKIAAKSGLLGKAERLINFIPGVRKDITENAIKESMITSAKEAGEKVPLKLLEQVKNPSKGVQISKASVKANEAWEGLVGKGWEEKLDKISQTKTIFEKLEDKLVIGPKSQKAVDFFRYDPSGKLRRDLKEITENSNEAKIQKLHSLWAEGSSSAKNVNPLEEGVNIAKGNYKDAVNSGDVIDQLADIRKENLSYMSELLSGKNAKALKTLENLTEEQRVAVNKTFSAYKTGVETLDRKVSQAILSKNGKKVLNSYANYIALFKNAKIGGNPSSFLNASFGNPVMTGMAGIDITNPQLMSAMKEALGTIKSNKREVLSGFLKNNPEWGPLLETAPKLFRSVYGVDPALLTNGERYLDSIFANMKNVDLDDAEDIKNMIREGLYKKTPSGKMVEAAREDLTAGRSMTGSALEGTPTVGISTEIFEGPYQDMIKSLEKLGEESGSKAFLARKAHWYLTKPMEAYEKIDQTYRLGLSLHLAKNGINERELMQLAKRVKIDPNDVTKIKNTNLFKLTPEKAMEASSEVYMNYLAMPGFVKMMRMLPILGSPFFSFVYGMGAITAKTAAYNPSYFNKAQFALKEIAGDKSPIEKEMLADPRYSWYNQEGMVKMPFFGENPVYLNMANMLPYYTLNIFQKSERTYNNRFGSKAAAFLDKIPALKTPEGQVMFNNIVQPLLLQGEEPKGIFNQAIWRKDAGLPEKLAVTVRDLAEAVVPPATGYLGLAGNVTPEAVKPWLPSYRWRSIANSVEGKTSVGIPTQEPAIQKTIRNLGSMHGFPTYQLKLRHNK